MNRARLLQLGFELGARAAGGTIRYEVLISGGGSTSIQQAAPSQRPGSLMLPIEGRSRSCILLTREAHS